MTDAWQVEKHRAMDRLMDEPEAYCLYCRFLHSGQSFFAVHPDDLDLGWSLERMEHAIAVLIDRGFISEIINPSISPSGYYTFPEVAEASDARG